MARDRKQLLREVESELPRKPEEEERDDEPERDPIKPRTVTMKESQWRALQEIALERKLKHQSNANVSAMIREALAAWLGRRKR